MGGGVVGQKEKKKKKQENTKGKINQKRIQKSLEGNFCFFIFRLMVIDDVIQTTYIQSAQEKFPFTFANSSLNHTTINSFSYKTIFFDKLKWYAYYCFVLNLYYSVSYMFKGNVHFP